MRSCVIFLAILSITLHAQTAFPPNSGLDAPSLATPEPPVVPDFLAPPPVTLAPLPAAAPTHRALPADLESAGAWTHTPSGERAFRLTLRSTGAVTLRLHFPTLPSSGALALYSARDSRRIALYTAGRDDAWSPLIPGDAVLLDYRPANPNDSNLAFLPDLLAHSNADPWAQTKGCDPGDRTCGEATWSHTRRAIAILQTERDGTSQTCAGWLANTRAGSRKPYLVTAASCVATPEDAATLTAAFPSGHQAAAARFLASAGGSALLELESAPPDAFFLGWTAEPGPDPVAPLALPGSPIAASPSSIAATRTPSGPAPFAAAYAAFQPFLEDAAACEISFDPPRNGFPAQGGNAAAAIETSGHCQWSASTTAPWIRLLSSAASKGPGSAAFHVAPNASRQPRSAALIIAGHPLTIHQQGVSESANCSATPIEIGAPVEAEFLPECLSALRPGRFSRRFTFQGRKADSIVVEAESAGFDPYLYLLDDTGRVLVQNDDGGEGTASRIPAVSGYFKLPYSGTYTLELSSSKEPGAGDFRLAACPGRTPIPIAYGQTVTGSLTASSCQKLQYYTQTYSFQGTAGQQVSIAMSSTAIDSFLVLNSPSDTVLAEDDDSGGGVNARIPSSGFYTLPQTGLYVIEASHWDPPFQTGSFTLSLTASAGGSTQGTPLRFVAVTPCRVVDTRPSEGKTGPFGPPALTAASTRDVPVPSSPCTISPQAKAYSLNVTVVPRGPLAFLTLWPTGSTRPLVSTLNSFDGRIVANAAIVPASPDGSISVYATDATDLIIDINGYFIP